jgi:hypothetical protein
VRAAGKAILMLAEEVERLQVELWHRRIGIDLPAESEAAEPGGEPAEPEAPAAGEAEPELATDLRSVVSRFRRRLQPARVFHRD